jgi:hypothetical protein
MEYCEPPALAEQVLCTLWLFFYHKEHKEIHKEHKAFPLWQNRSCALCEKLCVPCG